MKKSIIYGTMYIIYNVILIGVVYTLFDNTNSIILKCMVIIYALIKGIIQMIQYYYGLIKSITIKNEISKNDFEEIKKICFYKYTIKSLVFDAVKKNPELMQRVIKICDIRNMGDRHRRIYISTVGYILVGLFWSWDKACYFILPGIIESFINNYRINDEKKYYNG